MVIGGSSNSRIHEAEFVDFSHDGNAMLRQPSDLSYGMYGLVAGFVDDHVIACGGYKDSNCFLYNFRFNWWRQTVSMDTQRKGSVSFMNGDNTWYVMGGRDYSTIPNTYLNTTLVYNDGKFEQGQMMPYGAYFACSATVNETHIFFAGGHDEDRLRSDAYLLEVDSWTWTRLEDMAVAREYHSCGRAGRNIVVVGGYAANGAEGTSEIFNLDTMTWSAGPGVPTSSRYYRAGQTFQLEDTFYLMGGFNGNTYLDTVFEFVPEFGIWTERKERMMTARDRFAVVPVPRRLLE